MQRRRIITAVIFIAVIALVFFVSSCRNDASERYRPTHEHARYLDRDRIRFDDGDTFYLDDKPVRILGMDAPETKSPEVGILFDQAYGPQAAESTKALISRARLAEIVYDGKDHYGRRLAHVLVDGELLSVKLIEMGLAYENVSFFGDGGFPDLADRILEASRSSPRPRFQEPYKWRKKHQRRSGR